MSSKNRLSKLTWVALALLIFAMAFSTVLAPTSAYAAAQYATPAYNGQTAATWALNNVWSPSATGYYDYTNSGGDCTNFVSHAIKQGGVQMVGLGTNATSNSVWWQRSLSWFDANVLRKPRNSYTWTFANQFGIFLTKNSGKAYVYQYLYRISATPTPFKVGDIVQISSTRSVDNAYHTMIVTKVDSTGVYVTYRNATGHSAQKNKKLQEIMNSCYLTAGSKCATHYFIHIKIK